MKWAAKTKVSNNNKRLSTWLNLRSLVFLIALFLVLTPNKPNALDWLDRTLFSLGLNLITPQAPTVDVSIISLSEQEYEDLQDNWGQTEAISQLLNQLSGSGNRAIGIVFDHAPGQVSSSVDKLFEQVENDSSVSSATKKEVVRYSRARKNLADVLAKPKIINGLYWTTKEKWPVQLQSSNQNALSYVPVEESSASDVLSWLPSWLKPKITSLQLQTSDSMALDETNINFSPFVTETEVANKNLSKALLLASESGVHPEFLLRMLAQRGQTKGITWVANRAVRLDSVLYSTSADSSVVPYYAQKPEAIGFINTVSLSQALKSLPEQELVLIGVEDSQFLQEAALTLLSLDNQHYFYSPYWLHWVHIIAMVLVLVYLVFLLPKMGHVSAIFASSLYLSAFVVAQLGWQITQWQHLPFGLVIQYLVIGHVLMSLWKMQRDNLNRLHAAAHGARYQLGLQLFRDGRADDALLAVKECFSSDAVLNLMYDIASQQERKRQYGEAVKTYKDIVQRQPGFHDVKEKVEKLIAFSSGTTKGNFGGDTSISKTLIVSESSISKPVLGRYEIERELGRGAMGVVYLGRDPKIARQVAIKTLSYNNIGVKELDEFKERFFREAEAAGRLSHPNIVTIYDVGEEHDLAFIAMDYVEGESLGEFSDENNLLAVDKVFNIVVDVAEALFYAHDKQVVHRDIKPSNIMYEPKTGKVKVTDFGVARLIDSARTQTGDILGSPLYMSPEQLKGAKVTEHTDIYSLGVTFYQLLTGKLPHTGDSLANLTYNIIHEKHTGVRELRPELPKSITRIVNKAINKDPLKRYSNANDFAVALRKVITDDLVKD